MKKAVEPLCESLPASHEFHESVDVVWHEEGVLPRIAFCVVACLVAWVEVGREFTELSVAVEGSHTSCPRVVEFLVVHGEARESDAVGSMTEHSCHSGCAPACEIVFEVLCHALAFLVEWEVAEPGQVVLASQVTDAAFGIFGREKTLPSLP